MKHPPKEVGEALTFLERAAGQVSAVRRALEKAVEGSMDAPGGMEWEHQITAPPEEESSGPPLTPAPWEVERRKRTTAEFIRNWAGWPRRRRR